MCAGAIMSRRDSDAGRFGDQAETGSRSRIGGRRALRLALLRLDPGIVVLVGFAAALGWAFVGSLLLGLGAGSASRVAAWLWLAGEALIGAAVSGALLREWRRRRHRSQLDLALDAEVSQRHLSCLESGRAAPRRAARWCCASPASSRCRCVSATRC